MKKLKQFTFATLTVIVTLVVLDLALHVAASLSTRVDEATSILSAKIPDPKLGHRPNPAYPDHDAKGFRNPKVPAKTDIVALGDSQTYGSGVKAEHSWPRALESISELSVYNMGLGGWGPVHSLLLWDEAMEFKPTTVIEALYAGNDLHDAYSIVYNQGKLPELKTTDPKQLESIRQEEAKEPIQQRVSKMYRRGKTKSGTRKMLKAWMGDNSRVFGLIKRTQYELSRMRKAKEEPPTAEDKWKKAQSFAAKYSKYALAFSDETARTVFTSEYRLAALNLEDPRIREGQRISMEAIGEMKQLANRDGVRFIVLLIPTKELVFSRKAKNVDSGSYHKLLHNEQQFWKDTKEYFKNNDIEYIDSLKALQEKLETGPQPYMVSHNGHPNAEGQGTIAAEVKSYLIKNPE